MTGRRQLRTALGVLATSGALRHAVHEHTPTTLDRHDHRPPVVVVAVFGGSGLPAVAQVEPAAPGLGQ
jgi:hypothetical protein